jgi:hypothetical protein
MLKQETAYELSSRNSRTNHSAKKRPIIDKFILWFRNFIDNAE